MTSAASDDLPEVLATGEPDVRFVFISMSAREPDGQDAKYLEWHSLDHRPEQHRIAGLRHSLRIVSTPACRAARAISNERYDAVDHVMTYFFAPGAALNQFKALSVALKGERRPFRLPSIDSGYFHLAGKIAARRAFAGADVMPWRPTRGVYLLVEQGSESPASLVDVAGVAGIWWHVGGNSPSPEFPDHAGMQVTYCFLDDDPVEVANRMRGPLEARWGSRSVAPLLAAPFCTLVPFEWSRYLP
jgi:hypothetical protein